MTRPTQNHDHYVAEFAQFAKELASEPSWLRSIREAAFGQFVRLGFPTTRDEAWRFTNVSPIARTRFKVPGFEMNGLSLDRVASETLTAPVFNTDSHSLVFVNGLFSSRLSVPGSLPARVKACGLAAAIQTEKSVERHFTRRGEYRDQAFAELNTAFFRDGAFIEIPDGLVLERPIYLLFISTAAGEPSIIQPRNLILAGRESQATIIECYIGASGSYFTNSMTELAAGENSFIDSYKITAEGGFHIGRLQVDQQRDSSFSSNSISLGGPLVRNDLVVALNGEGAQCSLDGLYFAAGREHVDNHTVIDHAKAHCSSREMYKGVLAGKSSAVFNGSIVVRKDAQKTDAKQSNRNLLLSEDAVVNSKPELEIYADDVRCTHGTTIGQIEHDALFYLRSRGIGEEEARDLLTYAFATEILDRIKVAPIRAAVEREMLWRLSAAVKEA